MSKIFTIKTLNEFINEVYTATLGLKKNKWEELNPSQHPDELADEFFDLIQNAYAAIGGHAKIHSPKDVFSEPRWNKWTVVDIDADPEADVLLFAQMTKFGTKSSGVGHDGTSVAKREYITAKGKAFNKSGYYGEVSQKFAEIMLKKYNVPVIDNHEDVEKILNKTIEWFGEHPTDKSMPGNGWYKRKLGNEYHTKIMVGKPKI